MSENHTLLGVLGGMVIGGGLGWMIAALALSAQEEQFCAAIKRSTVNITVAKCVTDYTLVATQATEPK